MDDMGTRRPEGLQVIKNACTNLLMSEVCQSLILLMMFEVY